MNLCLAIPLVYYEWAYCYEVMSTWPLNVIKKYKFASVGPLNCLQYAYIMYVCVCVCV